MLSADRDEGQHHQPEEEREDGLERVVLAIRVRDGFLAVADTPFTGDYRAGRRGPVQRDTPRPPDGFRRTGRVGWNEEKAV